MPRGARCWGAITPVPSGPTEPLRGRHSFFRASPNAGRSRLDLGSEARSAPLHADPELRDSPQGQLVAPHKLGPTLRPEWALKSRWPLPEPTVLSLLQGHRAQEGQRAEGRGHRLLARRGRPGISGRGEAGTGQC